MHTNYADQITRSISSIKTATTHTRMSVIAKIRYDYPDAESRTHTLMLETYPNNKHAQWKFRVFDGINETLSGAIDREVSDQLSRDVMLTSDNYSIPIPWSLAHSPRELLRRWFETMGGTTIFPVESGQ